MSPTSRKTLMIGGALILLALLLVCSPLTGQFGSGGSSVEMAPAVATGPPADHTGALGAAAVGALAGASLGEPPAELLAAKGPVVVATDSADTGVAAEVKVEIGDTISGLMTPDVVVPVPVPGVAAGAAGAVAADGIRGESGLGSPAVEAPLGIVESAPPIPTELPPVGAAGLSIPDVTEVAASPHSGAGATTGGFDRAMASAAKSNAGVGAAGKVVARFAPPVAAPLQTQTRIPYASTLDVGALIKPCDTPGSSCRNLSVTGTPPPPPSPMVPNPPIIPGRLPPVPPGAP